MGKRSKCKSKQSAKQERALHLKNVEVFEETILSFYEKIEDLGTSRRRERIELSVKRIQVTLSIEESYAFINRYQFYKDELSEVCSVLLLDQIRRRNYIQALNAYNIMLKYPLTKECRSYIKPFSNLILLWTIGKTADEKEIFERKKRLDKITQDAIGIIGRPEARSSLQVLFLLGVLMELSQQRLFEEVEYLSLAMLKNVGHNNESKNSTWVTIAQTSLVFSIIDEIRSILLEDCRKEEDIRRKIRSKFEMIDSRPHCRPHSPTEHLALSLLCFYAFVCIPTKSNKKRADECIQSLEKYIALKSKNSHKLLCYTCNEEDTVDHEGLVCQACRVVSYCCKDHQRLNYLHHELTGTRGLGHKQLCPLFKAYRRKRDNADTSKEGHLERKFQRACKRFLRGTLQE
ncbi:predicted protein [Chaetoceros tenuissimus]|uniref:MYND-type domain-containing protein n=1 Tax=Chaetoceros tenuissimus TaxID=426638 RepID=A0AAD3D0D4_9STRA|nr:predicted protein [Chaetoceros tenuissimus]